MPRKACDLPRCTGRATTTCTSIALTSRCPTDPAELARRISDRHFGIGGDGLILICPSTKADARMRMFNADGSEAEMCGNGVRCVAKYVYDHGICRNRTLRIETGNGVLTLDWKSPGKRSAACGSTWARRSSIRPTIPVELPGHSADRSSTVPPAVRSALATSAGSRLRLDPR